MLNKIAEQQLIELDQRINQLVCDRKEAITCRNLAAAAHPELSREVYIHREPRVITRRGK